MRSHTTTYIALCALLLVIVYAMTRYVRARYYSDNQSTDTISVTQDTVYITRAYVTRAPSVREIVRVRYRTIAVRDTVHDTISEIVRASHDSVRVPIAQRVYADTLRNDDLTCAYEAYVSGYDARLDSLSISSVSSRVTTTREVIRTHSAPPAAVRRCAVGLQAGVYVTPGGVRPGMGVGVTYTIPIRRIFGKKY